MVKLQIDLSDEENKIIEMHKAKAGLETKEEALKQIVRNKGLCDHKFIVLKEVEEPYHSKDFEETFSDMKENVKKRILHIIQRCEKCGKIKEDKIIIIKG